MPLTSEIVSNKPLSGVEVRKLILADVESLLARDGVLSPFAAYGRVGWKLSLRLETGNPTYPVHLSELNPLCHPEEPGMGRVPLPAEVEEVEETELERSRLVTSPNAARLANDLPVTVTVKEGHAFRQKELKYAGVEVPPQPSPVDHETKRKRAKAKPAEVEA